MNTTVVIVVVVANILMFSFYAAFVASKYYIRKNAKKLFENSRPVSENFHDLGEVLINEYYDFEQQIQYLGINNLYECSSSIVSNASRNPIKYLIKYSEIEKNVDSLDCLDYCLYYTKALESLIPDLNYTYLHIKSQLPWLVKLLAPVNYTVLEVCNVDKYVLEIKPAAFEFFYESPASRTSRSFKVNITSDVLEDVISDVSNYLTRSEHRRIQRNLMTNDLREAIKKRDHYTCCLCGNSVYNEPNLLLEVDHIIPVSRGGKTEASNLQTLCWRCNRAKSSSM